MASSNIILVTPVSEDEEQKLMEGFFLHNSYDGVQYADGELPDDGEPDE